MFFITITKKYGQNLKNNESHGLPRRQGYSFFKDRPRPEILQPRDAVIGLTKTTICGTNLGIWKVKNPEIQDTAIAKIGQLNGNYILWSHIEMAEEVGSAIVPSNRRQTNHFLCQPLWYM